MTTTLKPTHKPILSYYESLAEYRAGHIRHEGALETAFQRLLDVTGRSHGWLLIPKLNIRRGGKLIAPDGTLRDEFNLHRGYWEAKDTDDDLGAEIRRKTAKGYPLINTIFEDTQRAVLFQNGAVAFEADLSEPQQLCDLLNAFYAYTEPDVEGFEKAVDDFKERVPELALALAAKIKEAHDANAKFQKAFGEFFTVCQTALNPNISQAAVDEMLVQHLLTERLIRTIFEQDDFTQKNVIAAEVEKVISALVSKSFSRHAFLKQLDRFYKAIEAAGTNIEDFNEKQRFLNTVYERFFQGYSVKVADTHGIVYTPPEIVDFMCASVVEVLEKEFGKKLGDKEVHILDPCTGTGNFIVNLLRRIPKKDLPRMYRQQLFANEVMLLPYYIAALNIEHEYLELTGNYEPFQGLCFVDTLDLVEKKQKVMAFLTQENTARVERQKNAPITVIIGNPPYNVGQLDENDNNKNRKYDIVETRIRNTYAKDSSATLKAQLYDAYVKFFRWASDRLQDRDGIVCFVSNNSFVDQVAFDGMRRHLSSDYARLYHVHLEGNVRENPTLAGTAYNVFGIQVGVGITVAVRLRRRRPRKLLFHKISKTLRRHEKLAWLRDHPSLVQIKWRRLVPDDRGAWLGTKNGKSFSQFISIGNKASRQADATAEIHSIFREYSPGVNSGRDAVVYDFVHERLTSRIEKVCDQYNAELDRLKRKQEEDRLKQRDTIKDLDAFVDYSKLKWSETLKRHLERYDYAEFAETFVRIALYRPFTKRFLFYDSILVDRPGLFRRVFPSQLPAKSNRVLAVSDIAYRAKCLSTLMSNHHPDMHLCASVDAHQCFPQFVYDEKGANRRDNVTNWALKQFQANYKDKAITKADIFDYVYGLLHHPGYREKYAENLKRELPRIPLAPVTTSSRNRKGECLETGFWAFSRAGRRLAELHVDYEGLEPWDLEEVYTQDTPLSYRVEKMKLTRDKTQLHVNESLTLANIPPEVFEYRLGNRSALEWVIDQYRVSQDERSGIKSDPNRPDDPESIVRLVGQVVRVSMETVKIVNSLPPFE